MDVELENHVNVKTVHVAQKTAVQKANVAKERTVNVQLKENVTVLDAIVLNKTVFNTSSFFQLRIPNSFSYGGSKVSFILLVVIISKIG